MGVNVYMSAALEWQGPLGALAGITPALGIGVARALQSCGAADITVKWPNDVYHAGAKVAGVLVETSAVRRDIHRVVVGIGINVLPDPTELDVGQSRSTLQAACAEASVSRERVAAKLVTAVCATFDAFASSGLATFRHDWERFDHFAGKTVVATGPRDMLIVGAARGLGANGGLRVFDGVQEHDLTVGEISLRERRP